MSAFSRATMGEKAFQICLVIFICLLCFVMVYPFIHMLSISFSTPREAMRPGIHLYPMEFSAQSYQTALGNSDIWRSFFFTVYKTAVFTVCSMIVMVCAAYALSRKYLPCRVPILFFITFTMYFGGGLIPTYLLVRGLGLVDKLGSLILPGLVSTFSLLILRNSFAQLSTELEESAKIDGANDVVILFRIMLPVSMPIIATVMLWTIVGDWNDYFRPMIYMTDPKRMVLQILLRRLIIENNDILVNGMIQESIATVTPESMKATILMITIAPILLVYPFLQKYFVSGIMVGSIKG